MSRSARSAPMSWLRITGVIKASAQLRLLDAVKARGIAEDDTEGVRRVWRGMLDAEATAREAAREAAGEAAGETAGEAGRGQRATGRKNSA